MGGWVRPEKRKFRSMKTTKPTSRGNSPLKQFKNERTSPTTKSYLDLSEASELISQEVALLVGLLELAAQRIDLEKPSPRVMKTLTK